MQYTEEWFKKARAYVEHEDLKAVKECLEHLPNMMDELNELLKKGDKEAEHFADMMKYYIIDCAILVKYEADYISCGHAAVMKTY